jgi:hypothetical protein
MVHSAWSLYSFTCCSNQRQASFKEVRDTSTQFGFSKAISFRLYADVLIGKHVHYFDRDGQTPAKPKG